MNTINTIINGGVDHIPEHHFMYKGSLDDVIASFESEGKVGKENKYYFFKKQNGNGFLHYRRKINNILYSSFFLKMQIFFIAMRGDSEQAFVYSLFSIF